MEKQIDKLANECIELRNAIAKVDEAYNFLLDRIINDETLTQKIQGAVTLHDGQLNILLRRFNEHIKNHDGHKEGFKKE